MAYEINADKYAFAQTPQPEKVCENYNAVLIRRMMRQEADKREALKSILEQNLANEVYARTDGDAGLKAQLDREVLKISELDTKLSHETSARALENQGITKALSEEKEQRVEADASFLQALDDIENELLQKIEQKANSADVYSKEQANEALANKSDVEKVLILEETAREINETKEDKVTIITVNDNGEFYWNGPDNHNTETRILAPALDLLCIQWWDGEYPKDFCASLSFNSGTEPTTISYPMGGIINWVGTDCVISEGISVFQPSKNTHYEIVMYYNGTQCIGLVNGFVPSTQEVDTP